MGTIREYGYREYPDHLTPAKGGQSNLLFDEARALTTHADFHATEREETSESSDVVVKAVAVIGAAALTYLAVKVVRRAVRAIRVKRSGETAGIPATTEAVELAGTAEDLESVAGAEAVEVSAADDALIEEVQALCEESSATLKVYRARRAATGEDSTDDEPRTERSQEQRRTHG